MVTVTGRFRLSSSLHADNHRKLLLRGRLLTPRGVHTHDLSCAGAHLLAIEGTHTYCLVQCLHLTVGRFGGDLRPFDVEAVSPNHVGHISQGVVHHFLAGNHRVDSGLVQCLVHSAGPSLTGIRSQYLEGDFQPGGDQRCHGSTVGEVHRADRLQSSKTVVTSGDHGPSHIGGLARHRVNSRGRGHLCGCPLRTIACGGPVLPRELGVCLVEGVAVLQVFLVRLGPRQDGVQVGHSPPPSDESVDGHVLDLLCLVDRYPLTSHRDVADVQVVFHGGNPLVHLGVVLSARQARGSGHAVGPILLVLASDVGQDPGLFGVFGGTCDLTHRDSTNAPVPFHLQEEVSVTGDGSFHLELCLCGTDRPVYRSVVSGVFQVYTATPHVRGAYTDSSFGQGVDRDQGLCHGGDFFDVLQVQAGLGAGGPS